MTPEEFGSRPLHVGTVTGFRSWNLAQQGCHSVLTPISAPSSLAWRPGENEAVCARSAYPDAGLAPAFSGNHEGDGVASLSCSCGFWAYYALNRVCRCWTCMSRLRVDGIVEGYGVATVGPLGFRTSRARIRALVRPSVTDWDMAMWHGVDFQEMVERYGVPLFDSIEEAVAAFPLTNPRSLGFEPQPTPEEQFVAGIVAGMGGPFAAGGFVNGPAASAGAHQQAAASVFALAVPPGFGKASEQLRSLLSLIEQAVSDANGAFQSFAAAVAEDERDAFRAAMRAKQQQSETRAKARESLRNGGRLDRRRRSL